MRGNPDFWSRGTPDILYPTFRLAGYPVKSLPRAFLTVVLVQPANFMSVSGSEKVGWSQVETNNCEAASPLRPLPPPPLRPHPPSAPLLFIPQYLPVVLVKTALHSIVTRNRL